MLYYEAIEKGTEYEWVVFIHGFGGSTKTWKKQIDDFKTNYNLLLIDLAGHGKSINKKNSLNILKMQDDIKDVLDQLNIKKAHFVGMSLGTLVLVFYALIYKETILSLTLSGAITELMTKAKVALWLANKMAKILSLKVICKIFAKVLLPKKNHKKSREIFVREAIKMKKEDLLKWLDILRIASHSKTYLYLFEKLKKIPILYIMGEEDHMFIRETKKFSNKIKNATLEIIKKCGHVCSIEKYKEFNKLVLNFIKKQKTST